ncbi:hypothetical protein AB0N14_13600 [Streptomyces sp. NPDC051104]|uniref:hypothetical protein n=1 Tax=Streptomyces sp. NPDC051104 TaxID=3155044 RepID=UPI003416B717
MATLGWTAKVRDHRTGEEGYARGTVEVAPGEAGELQAKAAIQDFVRGEARKEGHVVTACDIKLHG